MTTALEFTAGLAYHADQSASPRDGLRGMVAAAVEKWPDLKYKKSGSRAHSALEFVNRNQVHYLGETVTGIDMWEVNEHMCSIAGSACGCEDRLAPVVPEFGRLCKHRLAVYLQIERNRADLARVEQILSQARTGVTLEVRTYYRGDLHLQASYLAGCRVDEAGWQRWGHEDEIAFRVRDLERLMFRHGWRIAPGRRLVVGRHVGGRERWFLEPMDEAERSKGSRIATAVESLYGRDVATVEDQSRERRLNEMFREQLAA